MALWESPYYPFPTLNKITGKPILIDVTASCRHFENEIAGLSDVLTDFKDRNVATICEVGAGKLRNALFLLRQRFAVCAVEHAETFQRPQGKTRLAAARRFKKFTIQIPREFPDSTEQYDAILLINVVNVVPEVHDRTEIIAQCADHLRKDGLMVWMTQYGEPQYRRGFATKMRICDGYCFNLGNEHQTFVNEFTIPEIRELVANTKFRELRQLNVRFHHAFLFERR